MCARTVRSPRRSRCAWRKAQVEGSVVDTSTGKPVGGVKIITRDGDVTLSSDSGKWSMALKKKSYAIAAVKEGFYWPIVNFHASGDTTKVTVEIKPGGTVKGRVLDDQGKPISGAWVGGSVSGYFRLYDTKTDAEGRFVLGGQDVDSKDNISASADGYDYLSEQPFTFPSGQRETQIEVTLTKVKVRTITGRVTREDGSPVEGATVGYGEGTNYWDYASTKTYKDGKYALRNANVRKNMVVASCNGLAPAWKNVEADKDVQIDFRMKPGHTLKGRVENEDGKPIPESGWPYRCR